MYKEHGDEQGSDRTVLIGDCIKPCPCLLENVIDISTIQPCDVTHDVLCECTALLSEMFSTTRSNNFLWLRPCIVPL